MRNVLRQRRRQTFGSSLNQFDALVVISDSQGNYFGSQPEVLTYNNGSAAINTNSLSTDSVSTLTAGSGGGFRQYPAPTTPAALGASTTMTFESYASGCGTCQADKTVWPKVLIDNVADGVKGTLKYLSGYATDASTATSVCSSSNWCVGSLAQEQTDRNATDSISHTGAFHYLINAEYYDRENRFEHCVHGGNCQFYYIWTLYHWRGALGNPNTGTGVYTAYNVPTFSSNYAAPLGVGETKTRKSGKTQTFGSSFSLMGLIDYSSKAQYTGNTEMVWTGVSGCSSTRWLWGVSSDWPYANTVQNSCH
ncbi:MAG: hypothetical protein QOI39_2731 [Mycobacterium sp.]|jgi:hypothetical protein|nr:hypothetical protein [Mycobacterium sp.]